MTYKAPKSIKNQGANGRTRHGDSFECCNTGTVLPNLTSRLL